MLGKGEGFAKRVPKFLKLGEKVIIESPSVEFLMELNLLTVEGVHMIMVSDLIDFTCNLYNFQKYL